MKKIVLIFLFSINMSAQCWKSVSIGETHNVGIKTDGTLWSWGRNIVGMMGNGSIEGMDVLIPTQIGTATDWQEVHAGVNYTIALKTDDTLWAWGGNFYGELGDGTTEIKTVPTQIGTSTWKMVRAGNGHTLGIKTDGTLWAWGKNDSGALGDGTFVNKTVPTLISSTTDWEIVSCNLSRNIALKIDGTLWAWGLNSPALGLGFSYSGVTYITVPTQLGTDTTWKSAVVGTGHNLALKTNNTLWAWGGGNSGQCGNGTTTNNFLPTQVGTDTDWDAIEADGQTSFGVKTSRTLWAWGKNNYGQLGNNTLDNMLIPIQITTDNNWKSVSTSFGSTSALKIDGSLLTWGFNYYGQLGDGTNTDQLAPLLINTCSLNTTDFLYKEKFILYPNPAQNEVNIQFDSTFENPQLVVYDQMGRLVASYQASEFEGTWHLDLELMATGVYVVAMLENNQIIKQRKLLVL